MNEVRNGLFPRRQIGVAGSRFDLVFFVVGPTGDGDLGVVLFDELQIAWRPRFRTARLSTRTAAATRRNDGLFFLVAGRGGSGTRFDVVGEFIGGNRTLATVGRRFATATTTTRAASLATSLIATRRFAKS